MNSLLVELNIPNKTDVLNFLDGNGPEPARYAHVVINHRSDEEAYFQDILVGPLPINNATASWEPLDYKRTRKDAGKTRNLEADTGDEGSVMTQLVYPELKKAADITMKLWNTTVTGGENDTVSLMTIDPLMQDDGRIVAWHSFWNDPGNFDAGTLLPMGLFMKTDITGRDPSDWTFGGWLYNDIFYKTTEAFREAVFSPEFENLGVNVPGPWTKTTQQGEVFPLDKLHTPASVAPQGSRFSVDKEEKYVEWMGFSFYIGFSRDVGMTLYDIKYKGERLLYELGLQEALAHYAGVDPVQSNTAYLDSFYGFGPYAFELMPGYDCPVHATYLNSSYYEEETTRTHLNSICMYEFDADFPIQRHTSYEYISVTKNTQFSVRTISTIGNYDYMFTYSFFMDGSVAVEVRASGYIQSAYYAKNDEYGYHIHDFLSGSMHDHVLNFKADFDVLGTNNTVQLMKVAPTTKKYSWADKERKTMHVEREYLKDESQSKMDWDGQTQVVIVNQEEKNKYGENRGYRIQPYTGTSHLTVLDSSSIVNAAKWAEHDFFVTAQHDSEQRSAHPYNNMDVFDPPINFDHFFDGESLNQTDLVVWFNLGMHHVPHTGDLPNTVFTTAHSGVIFSPNNYFEKDQSRHTVNQVVLRFGDGEVKSLDTFGQSMETCELDFTPVEPSLENYSGEIVVRKFPFDPNNPWYTEA